MTENEITFCHEITYYMLEVKYCVMATMVWEVGLFIHFFVIYHTSPSAFIIALLCLCGCISGSQAYQTREQND